MTGAVAVLIGVLALALAATMSAVGRSHRPGQQTKATEEEAEVRRLLTAAAYAAAESRARALVEERDRNQPDSIELARALDLLVQTLVEGGKPADAAALPSANRAVALKEKIAGAEDPAVAVSLSQLGLVLRRQGKLADARVAYERALRIREAAFGRDHPDVARTLTALSALASNAGDFPRARELGERALSIAERTEPRDRILEATAANNLAIALIQSGDHAGSRRRFEQALTAYEAALGPEHPEVGKTLSNLATVASETGDLAAARSMYERAIAIQEKRQGPDHADVAVNVNNLAEIFFLVGDFATSATLYERVLRVFERAFGPQHTRVAMALGNLAQVRAAQEQYEQARPLFVRALAIREKSVGPDHPSLVYTLTGFADLQARLGEHEQARSMYERALAISERGFGADHPVTAMALQGLGDLRLARGQTADAEPMLGRALRIRRQLLGDDHPLVAETQASMALLLARTGKTMAAFDAALEAERVSRAHLQITAQALSERHALSYAAERVSGADVAVSLLGSAAALEPDAVQRTWDTIVRSRAPVLEEMASRQRLVAQAKDPDVARLARDLAGTRQRLAGLLVRSAADPASRKQIEEAVRERDAAERALAERSQEFRTEQARVRTGFTEASRSLARDAALVAFVRFRPSLPNASVASDSSIAAAADEYLAFVARGDGPQPVGIRLGSAQAIDERINRWRADIGGEIEAGRSGARSERVHREIGTALRRLLWDPLRSSLNGQKHIFIVPTGALHLVNWGALPDANGKYVVEGPQLIHYLSSESDLARPHVPSGSGLLLVDDPAYESSGRIARSTRRGTPVGGPRPCTGLGSLKFDPLPESRREGDTIAALWRSLGGDSGEAGVVRLTGVGASEAQVRQRVSGSRVLHFATHGFFLGAWCAGPTPVSSERHPLLLAGLALAGANSRTSRPAADDGMLLAEEIATLDLNGVEWAVLSACDTGAGVVAAGEELFGLRRVFQIAGVQTVIVSLWPVDDEMTRRWMNVVYRAKFVRNATTAAAVRAATIDAIGVRRASKMSTHPAYWGAFIAAGGS